MLNLFFLNKLSTWYVMVGSLGPVFYNQNLLYTPCVAPFIPVPCPVISACDFDRRSPFLAIALLSEVPVSLNQLWSFIVNGKLQNKAFIHLKLCILVCDAVRPILLCPVPSSFGCGSSLVQSCLCSSLPTC